MMRLLVVTSSIAGVPASALSAALLLGACQPSHPATPEPRPEPAPAAISAAPEAEPTSPQIAPEVEAPAETAVAAPQGPLAKVAAPPSASPAAKVEAAGQTSSAPAAVKTVVQPGVLPAGTGRNVAQHLCGTCHSLVLVTAAGHTEAGWDSIVARMEANGMQASADDIDTVITYLAKALPPR